MTEPWKGFFIVAPGNAWGSAIIKKRALEGHFKKMETMAHSFCKIYVHIIFSTKNRQCWLDESICSRVHAYLATLARNDGCPFVVVGGVEDHVHILADIGKKVKPIDMIRQKVN